MKKNISIWLLILAISTCTFIYALSRYSNKKDFVKPPFDELAIEGTPVVSEDLGYKQLDADGLYSIALCGNPTIHNNKLKIFLTSDKDNSVYLKARILKNDKIVGESGLIKPNEYIEDIAVKNINKGDNIIIKIMGYETDSYYSAGSIIIDLTVR